MQSAVSLLADSKRTEKGSLTYESVLLARPNQPDPYQTHVIHKTTSYTQIDAMLEKMLNEVEQQEKLFSLDLDVLDSREEQCVNTLELVPSTDALIEIPIKKTIRVPKKYETTHEINISDSNKDEDYELVSFGDPEKVSAKVDDDKHEYDLIDFGDDPKPTSPTSNTLEEIQDSVTKLLMEVENDEAEMLLQNIATDEYLESMQFNNSKKSRASSEESIKDSESSSSDSWEDESNVQDYEPIDTPTSASKFLSRDFENSNAYLNDIWYEGTYRNLSIVPEEDEENVSLIGSVSNKSVSSKNYSPFKNYEPISTSYFTPSKDSKQSSFEQTDSDSSEYSQEKVSPVPKEKIIKAEVKLLVKTVEHGKEAIEIRSVREFVDIPRNNVELDYNKRSRTLPVKQSKKETFFNKKYSDSCFDIRTATSNKETPVFTLPRVFIRANESKESTNGRTELVATPSSNFPLHSHSYQNDYSREELRNVDLFANTPFFPCYKSPSSSSPVESLKHPSEIPKAYCDWLPESYGTKGKVFLNFPC